MATSNSKRESKSHREQSREYSAQFREAFEFAGVGKEAEERYGQVLRKQLLIFLEEADSALGEHRERQQRPGKYVPPVWLADASALKFRAESALEYLDRKRPLTAAYFATCAGQAMSQLLQRRRRGRRSSGTGYKQLQSDVDALMKKHPKEGHSWCSKQVAADYGLSPDYVRLSTKNRKPQSRRGSKS